MAVGVLALQGGFAAHLDALARIGEKAVEVRHPDALESLDGLVLPGGESTTLLKLMDRDPAWWQALPAFVARGGALFGTCAGVILLAREVAAPAQRSLGLLDVTVSRNAYGRQLASCEVMGQGPDGTPLEMVFIRAPRIDRLGPEVTVLMRHQADPVLVRQGRILAATFHPELGPDGRIHALFAELVRAAARERVAPELAAAAG